MTNPNDPAFLTIDTYPSGTKTISSGSTKREYFAVMAMQGVLSSKTEKDPMTEVPRLSLALADALIAELNKEKKP